MKIATLLLICGMVLPKLMLGGYIRIRMVLKDRMYRLQFTILPEMQTRTFAMP